MKNILLILFTLFTIQVNSQIVGNVQSKQSGDNILITYNLSNSDAGSKVKINAYYAVNEGFFIGPLQKVSGDVNEISSGNGEKAITWNVLEEINGLEGNVKFKIEAIPLKKQSNPIAISGSYYGEIVGYTKNSGGISFSILIKNIEKDKSAHISASNIRLIDKNGNQFFANYLSMNNLENKSNLNIDLIKGVPMKIRTSFGELNANENFFFPILEVDINYGQVKLQFKNLQL